MEHHTCILTTVTVNVCPKHQCKPLKVTRKAAVENTDPTPKASPVVSIASNDIPVHLKGLQYDAVIVYAPQDEKDMLKLKYILENFVRMPNKLRPKLCSYRCDSAPNFAQLDDLVKRTSLFFLYTPRANFGDNCANHKKNEVISRCIEHPENRLVPVLSNRAQEPDPGIKTLKALYLDKFLCGKNINDLTLKEIEFSDSQMVEPSQLNLISRLFTLGLVSKQQRQVEQQRDLKLWLQHKIRTDQIKNAQKNIEALAQTNRC